MSFNAYSVFNRAGMQYLLSTAQHYHDATHTKKRYAFDSMLSFEDQCHLQYLITVEGDIVYIIKAQPK